MASIIVTGGAGFIGSHLVNRLIDENHDVIVIDNLRTGSEVNLNNNAHFINADLSSESTFRDLPNDVDYIFHLAAQASNESSCYDPIWDIKANTISTLNLLRYAKEIKIKKFLFTSTMGVYDDSKNVSTELSNIEPKAFYGIHKRASEEYIRIFSEEGMPTTILRLFNVYGPGQNMTDLRQGMLSIYMSFIMQNKKISVKGSLDRIRDFVYVSDVVNAIMLSAFNNKSNGKTLNVCTNVETSVDQAIKIIIKAFGKDSQYPIEVLKNTPGDIDYSCGDFSKIHDLLAWKPETDLEDGIIKMVNWLKGDIK